MLRPARVLTAPRRRAGVLAWLALTLLVIVTSCVAAGPGDARVHRWWSGLGPVLPHDTFPTECSLCHIGETWNELRPDFAFDHGAETGHVLEGAHRSAQCLRCHNDRGPVQSFQAKGCVGCHEDLHQGDLGPSCETCHSQIDWRVPNQRQRHHTTRFPLIGAHANVACNRCHPGAFVGNFLPIDNDCLTCHRAELAGTQNPPHIPLGWIDNCDRCHQPTRWEQGQRR